jgi:polar amino acid transport system permease protein
MVVILLFFSLINLIVARVGLWVERRLAVPGYGI